MPRHLIAALALAALAGCRAEAPRDAARPADAAAEAPTYLPFAVQVDGPLWFQTASFKDVGLRTRSDAQRRAVMEAVTDAFALRLGERQVPAHATYEPELADPAWHTQCRARHLYVDVWRSTAPDRLGFSLWKGCGADDRVAWTELPAPPGAFESADWLDAATRLGAAIADAARACPDERCG
jgi:hypothetical protein